MVVKYYSPGGSKVVELYSLHSRVPMLQTGGHLAC